MSDGTQGLSGVGDIVARLQSVATGSGTEALGRGSLVGSVNTTNIIIGLIAGLIGSAYFMYGKKTQKLSMVLSGIALCIVPYFSGNTVLLLFTCLVISALPFVI